ncbi:MAG: hypothetical protein ACFFAY_16245, partial [Promethearchaeota archaeon]
RMEFWDHFHMLAKEGKTIFMTTHYLDEATRCDSVAMIFNGRLLAHGPPEELISSLPLESTISGIIDSDDSLQLKRTLEGIAPIEIKGSRFIAKAATSDVKFRIFEALAKARFQIRNIVVREAGLEEAFTYYVRRDQE